MKTERAEDSEAACKGLANVFEWVESYDSTPFRMRYIIESMGRNSGADRCYVYFSRTPDSPLWDNLYEWCADGIEPMISTQQGVDVSALADAYDAISHGRTWSFTDVNTLDPATRAWMIPQGIQALILMPFQDWDGTVCGCIGFDFVRTRLKVLPDHLVRSLSEAVNMISFFLQSRHEQELSRSTDNLLMETGVGVWSFEMDEGAPPRMYGNKAMDDLLGCDGQALSPEEYYHAWYDHIHPDYYDGIHKTVENLVAGYHAEVQYPFLHPVRGVMWVRCGGRRDPNYHKGVRIVGRHQDITELLHLQKDNLAELNAVQRLSEFEKNRADMERDLNDALELLATEPDFTRVLDRLMALWCRSLGADWCVVGRFEGDAYRIVNAHAADGERPLCAPDSLFPYQPDLSGAARSETENLLFSFPDFQTHAVSGNLAGMFGREAVAGIASCYSRLIIRENEKWGSLVFFFKARHELTANEMRFVAAAAHGIELGLVRQGYEERLLAANEQLKRERDHAVGAEKAKSEFYSAVSHDIRTPVNAIVGFAELLATGGLKDPADVRRYVSAIRSSGDVLVRLVNDVLDLSRIEAGAVEISPVPTDVPALLRKVEATFRTIKKSNAVAFGVEIGPLPRVKLDRMRICQILNNLLTNAFKYTDHGHVRLSACWREGALVLAVEDTGIGVLPEHCVKILQPFVRVAADREHREGLGLGLVICKRTVEAMGGTLTVESEVGKGSTFTVTLPGLETIADDVPVEEDESARAVPTVSPDAPKRILVVDDAPLNRELLRIMLTRIGIAEVVCAADGAGALEILRREPAFDAVLSDLWMPKMDGNGLLRAIRSDERLAALKVYLITADAEAMSEYQKDGFDGILLKPISLKSVTELFGTPGEPRGS